MSKSLRALFINIIFACVISGCASSTAPITDFDYKVPEIPSLRDKSILVAFPISMKKALGIDTQAMMKIYEDKLLEKGESGTLVEYTTLKNVSNSLAIMAQYPYILSDALNKAGASARPGDTLDWPITYYNSIRSVESLRKMKDLGFDYVLVVSEYRSLPGEEKVFKQDRHYVKNIFLGIFTLGLLKGDTFSTQYIREYELISTTGRSLGKTTLTTSYVYDDTSMFTKGFTLMDRIHKDSTTAQLMEVPNCLMWLEGLKLKTP